MLFRSSVQSLSRVLLFGTPWTAACQASLSKHLELAQTHVHELVMPSNHLILCHPFFSCLQSFPASGAFPTIHEGVRPLRFVWSRKWQPTPVFWPGKFHGQRSLPGYSPWGHKQSDTQTHVHRVGDAIQPSHPLSSLLLLPSIFPSIRVFSNESGLRLSFQGVSVC